MNQPTNNRSEDSDKSQSTTDDTVAEFLSSLRTLVDITDQKAHLRMTFKGLFVSTPFFEKIITIFQNWFEKKTSGEITRTKNKCIKRLFGSLTPQQYYLVEGKTCLMGNLISYQIQEPQKLKLPYYLGSLLDTQSYLHPKDPLLEQLKCVEALATNAGISFRIKMHQQVFEVSTAFLTEFAQIVSTSSSKSFEQTQGEDDKPSLRTALPLFVKLLQHSRPLGPKWRLLVPAQYEHKSEISFRQNRDWVFILDAKHHLITSYQLHGRNLFRFIWREYVSFRQRSKSQRIGNFELRAKKSNYCGVFKMGNSIYVLPPQTLKQFIEQIAASPKLRESLPARYTVGDCLRKFCSIFQGIASTRPPARATTAKAHPLKERQLNSPSGWTFTVNHRQVITSCMEQAARRLQRAATTSARPNRRRSSQRAYRR